MRALFPAILQSQYAEAIQATSVLIANDSDTPVKALALQWIIVQRSGQSKTLTNSIFPEPSATWLPGDVDLIPANGYMLATPKAYETGRKTPTRSAQSPIMVAYEIASSSGDSRADLADLTNADHIDVQVLEVVTLKPHATVGTNSTGLTARVACERNAAIVEAQSLASDLKGSDRPAQLLKVHFFMGRVAEASDLCPGARAREAARLLDLEAVYGQSYVVKVVNDHSSRPLRPFNIVSPPPANTQPSVRSE
jgi:hypothetical protein